MTLDISILTFFEQMNQEIKEFISSYQADPFLRSKHILEQKHHHLNAFISSSAWSQDKSVMNFLEKMSEALNRFLSGDDSALLGLHRESYHMLLWQLHQYINKNKKQEE